MKKQGDHALAHKHLRRAGQIMAAANVARAAEANTVPAAAAEAPAADQEAAETAPAVGEAPVDAAAPVAAPLDPFVEPTQVTDGPGDADIISFRE
jgi:hypothetical protein